MLRALQARYVFPVTSPPIEGGAVLIDGDRIVEVVRAQHVAAGVEREDLGNVAIIPGLVNAHTHLEFSDLAHPLGTAGMVFPQWIRAVIAHRRETSGDDALAARAVAIKLGVDEALRTGTTTLGEIATAEFFAQPLAASPLGGTVFLEALGVSPPAIEAALERAHIHTIASLARTGRFAHGLSPHAPYSTHWDLFTGLAQMARAKHAPIAMHLAESPEELELLHTHGGAFRELLDDLGVWNPAAIPRGKYPLDYLRLLASSGTSLVIHGNYLDRQEIAWAGRMKMSVVYCPRTHSYFQHEPYPLRPLLDAGVNVALGTDSRASNPDLNLLAEMRHVARHHDVDREEVLAMGTLHGAQALGWGVGVLESNRRADFAVVALANGEARDPHELLFADDSQVVATYCGGVRVSP